MALSYSTFCMQLGAPLYNKAWSWSARSRENRLALFTVWEDRIEAGEYIFPTVPRDSDVRVKPGRTELISILDETIDRGFAAYGIQCKAADINANPRQRKSFDSEYVLDMRIRKVDDDYIGHIVGHVPPSVIVSRGTQAGWIASSAINDLDEDAVENSDPEYRKRMSGSYVRDARVREQVLKRAGGVCEECNQPGFLKVNGNRYLETHHVISLSEQGTDMPHNVIALCANDHRRAHYSKEWAALQDKFLAKLQQYRTD